MNNARRRKSLYIYRSAKKNFSFYFYIDDTYIYIYTTENVFLFCSSVASQWHSLWKYKYHASFCSFGSLITEKGKCYIYIYVHMEKCLRIYPYDIFYSNLYPTTLEKNNIFFSRTRIFSFSFKKKERERKTILTISPIVLTHVSLNDWLIFLRSRLAETMCNETCERKVPLSAIIDS